MGYIFALDIGTRVVIGLVIQKNENGYEIIASARTEHTQRAMYDGQVHDVNEVANAVLRIKKELEQKINFQLNKVAVAAAGRALCTETTSVSREEVLPVHWEHQEVLALEMEAVQKAMKKISSNEMDNSFFYCVGYSTVKYMLEDQQITSLLGQKGKKAELTVIATFLPRIVVDGLVAVLARADLEMESLTLEPIAAGQAAIPSDMRRLNLALVDIGAGTADIALTKDGSFFSYGMVPMAGDEVTETICSHYLVDFQEGEKIKRGLSHRQKIEVTNFFGEKCIVSKQEVLEVITPTVQTMAERIGQEILLLNKNCPQAIILVGGGSLTPLLGDFLAKTVSLPRNRIGLQVRERLSGVIGEEDQLTGSDVITPIGIGMAALDGEGLHYYSVSVNNMNTPLFELQLATIAEALLAAGIQPRSFFGRPGAALVYEVNGQMKTIKGDLGSPAQVSVNNQPAKLDQKLYPDDKVTFVPGVSGEDAKAQVKDVVALPVSKKIIWNGQEQEFKPVIYLNNKKATEDDWLEDGSRIIIKSNDTLLDVLTSKGINLNTIKKKKISINGKLIELESDFELKVNGQMINENCMIVDNDRIDIIENKVTIKELQLQAEPMYFTVNETDFHFPPKETKVLNKGKELSERDIVEDGMELRVEGFSRKPILSELFPYLKVTEKVTPGGKLEMIVNGNKALFTTQLNQGDRIEIKWIS